MAAKAQTKKAAAIGTYGIIPKPTGEVETTVLTMGGTTWAGFVITIVHVVTWITAMCLILLWANPTLGKINGANDSAKMLGNVYAFFIIAILVTAILHAAFARKEETFGSTLASLMLLSMVGFENSMGCAYVAYSLTLGDSNFYSAAIISQLFVSLGSSMIFAFYVNWSHNGNVKAMDFSPDP